MTSRAVVIGLDGAAWHLLDPMIDKGIMPRLAELRRRGSSGRLTSTIPTYTPPAWTSAATGVNPGRHGIYGFVEGHAQYEHQVLMHSGRIRSATIWQIANAQGARVGVYNLPLTYPPRELDGWMVSGMLTPGYGERTRGFASWSKGGGAELEQKIFGWAPEHVLDLHANYEQDWRDETLARRGTESVRQRTRVLQGLIELDPPDLLFAVIETPDRLQHVYYRYMDPSDPMYDIREARAARVEIERCFAAIDESIGVLADYAGAEGGIFVCSDHGFTAWEVSVHTNALLAEWGFLKLKTAARVMQTGVARSLVPVARRFLPRKLARRAKGRTFAAIDWAATRAFASPIPQQGIFVNLKGRERYGVVEPSQLYEVKLELKARFERLTGPDGSPVTDRVYLSEQAFNGEALDGAPDVLPILRDHRFELDDELFHTAPFTDYSHLPRGVHHPDGIGIVAGPGVDPSSTLDASVLDVTPTLLYLAGLRVPEGLDGGVVTHAFPPEALKLRPVATVPAVTRVAGDEESPYSPEEEAQIEESLRGLGYL